MPSTRAIFSLSSTRWGADCTEVMRTMRDLGLMGDVTSNRTLLGDGTEERGCRVLLADITEKRARAFWGRVQRLPGITCAHVEWGCQQNGCVYDVFRASACPGVSRPAGRRCS